jgi:GNAT superfamily N-acetyltransferase
MKLMNIYEDVMNELVFSTVVDEDSVTINAIKNKQIVGKIVIERVFDAYREFIDVIEKGEMTDDEYNAIFPNDTFTKIEYLNVVDGEKGNGYAKQLMERAISYARSKGETVMYLNASPMGFSGLNVNDLSGFYNAFGFQTLIDSGHNVEMFANI